jgi:hypothetical protein
MSKKLRFVTGYILAGLAIVIFLATTIWSSNPNEVLTGVQSVLANILGYGAWICALVGSFMISTGILYDWLRKTSSIIYRWSAIGGLSLVIFCLTAIVMVILGLFFGVGAGL